MTPPPLALAKAFSDPAAAGFFRCFRGLCRKRLLTGPRPKGRARVRVSLFRVAKGGIEFVDDRGDKGGFVVDQLEQVRSAGRSHGFQVAGSECVLDLLVEIIAISNDQYARIGDGLFECLSPAEHDHGKRFPRPLSVPDYAAFSRTLDRHQTPTRPDQPAVLIETNDVHGFPAAGHVASHGTGGA